MNLILASKSAARQAMLKNAGLTFKAVPAELDEDAIKNTHADQSPQVLAQILADEKALAVALKNPQALVIGSDQILECEGRVLSKAENIEQAKEKLSGLRGRAHHLISAVSVAQGTNILWQNIQSARLSMHNFNDAYLDQYCSAAGEALTKNVGAYALEGIGVRLFDSIEGDYFTILGMPLLPLLKYLRQEQGIGI